MDMSTDHTSVARVRTQRPARFGHQLTSHMGRKITTAWDPTTSSGLLDFGGESAPGGTCTLTCEDDALVLTLRSDAESLAHLEHVVGIHLARFGSKDALEVVWVRADGSPGTTQGPISAEELAAHHRERDSRGPTGPGGD